MIQISNKLIKELLNLQKDYVSNVNIEIATELITAYTQIEKELNLFVAKYGTAGYMPDSVNATKYRRLENLLKNIEENLYKVLGKIDKNLQAKVVYAYQKSYYWNAYLVSSSARILPAFGVIPESVILAAINYPMSKLADSKLLLNAKRDTFARIKTVIRQAIIQGQSIDDVSTAIANILGVAEKGELFTGVNAGKNYKYQRIARTEISRVFNQAAVDEMYKSQKLGIDQRLQLLSTIDDRTRTQSATMDGQISNKNGKFKYPNGSYYIVGQTGNPAWDINDRETTIPYIKSVPNEVRRKYKDVGEYETFLQFAEKTGYKTNKYGQSLYSKL